MYRLRSVTTAAIIGTLLPATADLCPAAEGGTIELSIAAAPDGASASKTSGSIRLGISGEGSKATARFETAPPPPDGEVAAQPMTGTFSAPSGGTLRLEFGAPAAKPAGPKRTLLAFWRFDEPDGKTAADLKSPDTPAKLAGVDPKKKRPVGVGFDKVHAVELDGGGHVQTAFKAGPGEDGTLSVWVKTGARGAAVLAEALDDDGSPTPGSRTIHIGADGHAYARIAGEGAVSLRSPKPVNDNKWQHLVWTTRAGVHQLFVAGKPVATVKPEPGADKSVAAGGGGDGLKLGAAFQLAGAGAGAGKVSALKGQVDNLRIYNTALTDREIDGIYQVGARLAPIMITSEPKKVLRAGENFAYALEYTGAPYSHFQFIGLPKWMKFEGQLVGTPGDKDVGLSPPITITGTCPWGPAQQRFQIKVLPRVLDESWELVVDGKAVEFKRTPYGLEAELPEGEGKWELRKKG